MTVQRGLWQRLGILALLLALPLFIKSNYLLSVLVVIGLYTIVVEGLGLLMGQAGQVSFGHAAFYGLGAYTAAILSATYGWPPLITLPAAVLLSAVVAALIGRPTLKLRQQYLALATLAFSILVYILLNELTELTGGPSGLTGIPYLTVGNLVFNEDIEFYYLVWALVGLVFLFSHSLAHSRVGRALKAIRDSEVASAAVGMDTASLKLQVFIYSAMLAGLAGGLYTYYITFISPGPFSLNTSIQFVLMAVVGGLGSLWGPPVGVAVITILTEILRWAIPALIPNAGGEYEIVFFGLALVVVMILRPEGLCASSRQGSRERKESLHVGGKQEPLPRVLG